jgi:hypothetical protein
MTKRNQMDQSGAYNSLHKTLQKLTFREKGISAGAGSYQTLRRTDQIRSEERILKKVKPGLKCLA